MEYQITYKLFFIFFLFLLSGFFSCSEAALFSLTPLHLHKMAEDKTPFLAYVRKLLQYPRRLLITLIVGNEAINIGISVLTASLFIQFLGMNGQWVAIAVTTTLLVIFGEAIPKTFAVVYPMPLSSVVSPLITFISKVERPVVWMLEKASDRIVSLVPGHQRRREVVTEDEFRTLIDAGHQEGALEGSQRDLIHRVFELGDKPVSEIMVPRVDMFCLPVSMGIEEMEQEVIRARHAMIPVYGADRDDIQGILYAKDLLERRLDGIRWVRVQTLLKKPYFVPLEKTAGSLLQELQARKMKMAILVDEYGGVSGMVTLQDILEDLVEDLYDQYAHQDDLYQQLDDNTWIVSGRMPMDDFSHLMGHPPAEEDFETVGGFIFHLFGNLPSRGDTVSSGGYLFRVEQMGKVRILKVRVERAEGDHG